jgi:hypothetical protein
MLRPPADTPARNPAAIRPPSLRITMDVGFPDDPTESVAAVHVAVTGGRAPVRLHFYVDGELVAAQCGTGMIYDVPAGRVPAGTHTITVRASDALGRWADTSMQLELPLPELGLRAEATSSASGAGTGGRGRRLLARFRRWRDRARRGL